MFARGLDATCPTPKKPPVTDLLYTPFYRLLEVRGDGGATPEPSPAFVPFGDKADGACFIGQILLTPQGSSALRKWPAAAIARFLGSHVSARSVVRGHLHHGYRKGAILGHFPERKSNEPARNPLISPHAATKTRGLPKRRGNARQVAWKTPHAARTLSGSLRLNKLHFGHPSNKVAGPDDFLSRFFASYRLSSPS